ncbi:dephospho-CoA kinase [Paenibacillus sp. IB182496]|uniref:Dephospho-CoA kinase n=1 Tax=Paenibacillus sabuli TaxID=2772509 RepID=A0A927BTI1_9BACL|nr:dephospho-CoA kinase [Paenibacillus sabuli]MBD2846507.1 dephospho-CoA kinase [Paenibacillus sabuli]
MKIGLTGGIASGKSTVGALLTERGAVVVDADQLAREVVLPGEPALAEVARRFGASVLHEDGTLDRKALGAIVFGDRVRLTELEGILHPAIRQRMRERLDQLEAEDPGRLHIADVPLLYETGQAAAYGRVLVVYVPREVQVQRLAARSPELTAEQAAARVDLQMDIEEKRRRADWVVDNSGTREETRRQLDALWREMMEL